MSNYTITSETAHIEVPGTRQAPWEMALEDALCYASPEEVLVILRKIKGWTSGYCVTCGTYNVYGTKRKCECTYKGEWDA